MSKTLVLTLATLVSAAGAAPAAEPEKLRGEIVDVSCYLDRGAVGPEHAECANACIDRNHAAGFKAEDGTFYLLLPAMESPQVPELVADLAGVPIEIAGTRVERDGVKAFRIRSAHRID